MKFFLYLTFLAICGFNLSEQSQKARMIITEIPDLGTVKGRRIETAWTGKRIYQFFDIKYGESTSGDRRFKAPVQAESWEGTRNAFAPRKGCPSIQDLDEIRKTEGRRDVEDCLTLTINTRNLTTSHPVMVYLHGEFLYEGTTLEATPEYLLEKDVVLVAVRYRLAPFGFLSTLSDEIPGNAAVLDVILALQWIQKNIKYFGGDPTSVTLFGQVGGAAIANLLTMSPIVPDDLFQRVIYMSASALTPAFVTEDPIKFSKDIAKHGGCKKTNSIDKLNKCLMKMNATTLLDAFSQHGIKNADNGVGTYGGLQFVVGGPSGVLPSHPEKLIADKKIRYYPTMGGVTKNAGTFLLKEIFEDNFNQTIPDKQIKGIDYVKYIIKQVNGEDSTNAWESFSEKNFFTKAEIQNGTFRRMLPGLIDMCGTIPFKNPVLLALQANAVKLPNSTYLYSFNYEGDFNRYISEDEDGFYNLPFDMGVSLTDDNLYLFPWPQFAAYLNRADTKIARKMVALWTSFAKNSQPRAGGVRRWPPMTKLNGPYLRIDNSSSIGKNFLDEYVVTVRDARKGYSLVADEFWYKDEKPEENNSEEDEEEEEEEGEGEGDGDYNYAEEESN